MCGVVAELADIINQLDPATAAAIRVGMNKTLQLDLVKQIEALEMENRDRRKLMEEAEYQAEQPDPPKKKK